MLMMLMQCGMYVLARAPRRAQARAMQMACQSFGDKIKTYVKCYHGYTLCFRVHGGERVLGFCISILSKRRKALIDAHFCC